jgi:hypothetical protein
VERDKNRALGRFHGETFRKGDSLGNEGRRRVKLEGWLFGSPLQNGG